MKPGFVYQKADGNSFLRQERSAGGEIYVINYHNNVISVLRNTEKNYVGLFRTKGEEC
jgi:hypothetical protein